MPTYGQPDQSYVHPLLGWTPRGGGGVPAGARLLTIVTMVAHVVAVVVPQRGAVAARIVKESAVRIKQTSLSTAQIQGTWDACTAPVPHATAWGRWAVGGAGCPF